LADARTDLKQDHLLPLRSSPPASTEPAIAGDLPTSLSAVPTNQHRQGWILSQHHREDISATG
jgi:hypothetical protein